METMVWAHIYRCSMIVDEMSRKKIDKFYH